MAMGDLRNPIRMLTAATMVHSTMPIVHARMVSTGASMSSVGGT